jgi:hypothetical protein
MQPPSRGKDRRAAMRFEIVGLMRGTISAEEPLEIRNIGAGGALVEAPWPLDDDSVHTVRLDTMSTDSFDVRVCHVTGPVSTGSYLIGLEFLALDLPAKESLAQLLSWTEIDT